MSQDIQQRVRKRREDFGASIEQMAAWADLTSERWLAIEGGDSLSVTELGQVARALAVDPGTFLRGEERNARRSVVRFRQATEAIRGIGTSDIRTLALAAELGRIGGGLHRLLSKPVPLTEVRQTKPVSDKEEPWRQGYRLGADARRSLNIPPGPIVDLQRTLEGLGVHIVTLPFSHPSIDAASLMEDGAMPIILLNRDSPRIATPLPRRTSMAHELCHLLHDAGEQDLETRLTGSDSSQDDSVEQRARAFAPAFLAPRDEIQHWFRSGEGQRMKRAENKVLALAKRWGLSWRAAVWHAKNCGLIRPATASSLEKDSVKKDWQEAFEGAQAQRTSLDDVEFSQLCQGRLAELVIEAYEAGAISRGRAREIALWD